MTATPISDLNTFLGADPNGNRLYDNVQATVPAVTLSMIKMAAWGAIEEFYLLSTVERRELNWTMGIGVQSVDFNPVDETWVVAWVLDFCGLARGRVDPPAVLFDCGQCTAPRAGKVLLALKPVEFAACMPSTLWSHWFEVILDGTLFRLYNTPAKPYSNAPGAAYHGRRYRAGIGRARATASHQNTDGGGRWQFPLFAMGRRKQ